MASKHGHGRSAIRLRGIGWLTIAIVALAPAGSAAAQGEPVSELIRFRIEQLLFAGEVRIEDVTLTGGKLLPELYARREFRPAWTPERADEWLDVLGRIGEEGLRPEDYHLASLERLRDRDGPDAHASFDLLLTASLIRAGRDLRYGKVDPTSLDRGWNLDRDVPGNGDLTATLEAALSAPSLEAFIDERLPRPRLYDQLKAALAEYRSIAARGGWPTLPEGPTMRRAEADARVPVLRERLALTGDYTATPSGSAPQDVFDADLESAVMRFQIRHGLAADGAVGAQTLAALNVPVGERIDQIRLNLERGRWVFGALDPRFLVVNIASFQVFLVENDVPVWTARTQVGRAYRQTPVFRSEIEYLVLNPTWTIPPTILRQDVLPRVKTDPAYLERQGIDVLTPEGKVVPREAIDWSQVAPSRFPYVLRQRAGAENPLGRLKIIFPNEHLVYLHDTPSRALFERPERTFSSGCIRVEDAVSLAELVLADSQRWSKAKLDEAIATGATQTVYLREPLPILVLYWTASVDALGNVRFLPDIYRRDAKLLAALDAAPPLVEPL